MYNDSPLFSIVVACYNVEKYVKKCITSIINQSFTNYELIIINDGSNDRTEEVIKKLKLKANFIYLKKKNGGLSSVRNYGIKYAKGKYVIQFDGDDFVEENWLNKISKVALNKAPDMIIWGGNAVNEQGSPLTQGVKQQYDEKMISSKEFLYYLGENRAKNWSWSFAFKKDLINKNDLPIYPEGIFYEDLASTYKIVEKADKIYLLSGYLYHYTQHKGTITKNPNLKQYNDLEIIKSQVKKEFSNDYELKKIWTFQITIMQYQIISRIKIKDKKRLLKHCTNIIVNHKSKYFTRPQLIKYYLVKLHVYSYLYRKLYKYRS